MKFHPRRTLRVLLLPLTAGLALTFLPAQAAHAASTPTNGGFESDGTGTATPAGWSEYGDTGASYTEAGGHSGSYRLTQYSSSAYKVETYQYLSGLTNGVYWEATWTAVSGNGWDPTDATSGNGWENQALFGYDDKALSSMTWFSHR